MNSGPARDAADMVPAEAAQVLERLEDTRQRWWLLGVACGVLAAATASAMLLVLFVLLDVCVRFSQLGLGICFGLWVITTLTALAIPLYRMVLHQRNLEAAARRIEIALPAARSDLVNLVQFSRAGRGTANGRQDATVDAVAELFRRAAQREAARRAAALPIEDAARAYPRWTRWRLGIHTAWDLAEVSALLVFVLLLGGVLAWSVPTWQSAADRLLTPWRYVPQVGRVVIRSVEPGNADVLAESRLAILATIEPVGGNVPPARIVLSRAGRKDESRPMLPLEDGTQFTAAIPAVMEPFSYRVEIGDSQSALYRITVSPKPVVQDVEIEYAYPAYLGRETTTVRQRHADLEAPQYTRATLRLHSASPLARGFARWKDRTIEGTVAEDPHTLILPMLLDASGEYTIHLVDVHGHVDPAPRVNSVRVTIDGPPSVAIVKPARESQAATDTTLPIVVRAADDHGLGEVELQWRLGAADMSERSAASGGTQSAQRWTRLAGATATTLTHRLQLDASRFPTGSVLFLRAVARDQRDFSDGRLRMSPQETTSDWIPVRLVDGRREADEALDRVDNLRSRLWRLLHVQLRARATVAQLQDNADDEQFATWAGDVERRQKEVFHEATDVAGGDASNSADRDREASRIVGALRQLIAGDLQEAVELSEQLTQAMRTADRSSVLMPLAETQDRVIAVLRRLLDQADWATFDRLRQMEDRGATDLPNDTEQKLRDMADKLREFMEQQKRVIETTDHLAKKPVEDFTREDEQTLQELAAVEDQWARFLEETASDFSKLPEQDFANPSMMQELVEVATELKMAADALTKKAVEIAVPLEQIGLEMAEQMTTNIEKWLPDTPDREQWKMAEPPVDERPEAPMAELPGELEDLVGELMEDEEDLFDEMEDMSSSWADSLDKGAGWDAADGPISNMSARGVTGNRLPNTSEIGGRSGEGRQGKASGEFVGDTAVGKGGRRTPTRLAPDPQVAGQIDDQSKDPVGGATGGGKESGVGGEGLEGPVPADLRRDAQRLATRQAELRNRAEAIDLRFQVLNYRRTDLSKMMDAMLAVERDLRSGNYQSALRRKEVLLEGLHNIKTYVGGEYEVRRDESTNLPRNIQNEILGGLREASPFGWEDWNRKYFERLTRQRRDTAPADHVVPAGEASGREQP